MIPEATIPHTLQSTLSGEKRRLLDEGGLADVLGSVGAVAVICLAEFVHADPRRILAWALGMALLLMVQLAFPGLMRRRSDAHFLSAYTVLAVVLGLAWASCVLLIRPDDFAYEAFVVLALCVVFTAGSVFNAHHLPMLYGFQVAGMGCLAIIYALRGGTLQWGIAAGFAILMWTLIGYGRVFHRSFSRAIELDFENARLVAELTGKSRALEQANVAKTRFLAAASHDLRQPLHALTLLVALLAERTRQHGVEDLIARLDQSAEAMESLLNAILDISRLDAGVEHPQLEALSSAALLERVERQFMPVAAAQGLSLRVRVASHSIHSDAAMLARMLDNLVSNALRYTRRGGVLVGVRKRGERLAFEVWDTGVGIAADRLDEVFHEFVQLDNPGRDRSKGLGLGLSIVRRTAQLLGHGIEVASRPGRGSVFRLLVPPSAEPAQPPTLPEAAEPRAIAGLSVRGVVAEPPILAARQGVLVGGGGGCRGARAGGVGGGVSCGGGGGGGVRPPRRR